MSDELSVWRNELLQCAKTNTVSARTANPFPVQPVLILVGTCKKECGEAWGDFLQTLEEKLSTFSGRVISGGTCVGICAELGRLSDETARKKRKWISVGYLPRNTSVDLMDNRYDELIFTDGQTFSEIEPLQYWTDILASGISPKEVGFIRYGGGKISEYEEHLFKDLQLPQRS